MSTLNNIKAVASNYTVKLTDSVIYAQVSVANLTVTLPAQPVPDGVRFTIFRSNDGATGFDAIVNGNGSTINGASTISLDPNVNVTVVCYSKNWFVADTNLFASGSTGPTGPTGPAGAAANRLYGSTGTTTLGSNSNESMFPASGTGTLTVPLAQITPGRSIRIGVRGSLIASVGTQVTIEMTTGGIINANAGQTIAVPGATSTGTVPFSFDGTISVMTVSGTTSAQVIGNFILLIAKGGASSNLTSDISLGSINQVQKIVNITSGMTVNVFYRRVGPISLDSMTITNASIHLE